MRSGLGRGRSGTVDRLRAIGLDRGFTVVAVDLLTHADRPISATWIREALAAGDVSLAGDLLGSARKLGVDIMEIEGFLESSGFFAGSSVERR